MTEVLGAQSTTIETYYEILRSGADRFDAERLRAILDPQLIFEGPIAGHRVGAEPFCKGVVGFVSALQHLEMRQLVTTPGKAAALYDAELPGGTCRFAEFFELDTGVDHQPSAPVRPEALHRARRPLTTTTRSGTLHGSPSPPSSPRAHPRSSSQLRTVS